MLFRNCSTVVAKCNQIGNWVFPWVKCQNLSYLNLSFYFNHLCHFKSIRALYHLTVVIVSPLHFHHSVQMLSHSFSFSLTHTPLPTSTCQQNRCDSARFCAISLRHLFTPIPFLSAHPSLYFASQLFPQLHFANAVVKLLFSLDVFHSLPPNHTNQIAASITQIVVPFATNIITSTFTSTCHSFSNFDSTSARLHSSITYWFPPHICLFQL